MSKFRKTLFWIPGATWAAVLYAGQVGPDDAKANLGKWAIRLGVNSWPAWILETRTLVLLTLCVGGFYAWLLWRHFRPRSTELALRPSPNMSVGAVIEYIVNDSTAVLEQNPPPEIAVFGPAKGQLVTFKGRPEQDALRRLEESTAAGSLDAFGRIALNAGESPVGFETALRQIPQQYWQQARLHPMFAQVRASRLAQTIGRPSLSKDARAALQLYADLRFDRRQVTAAWRPKPLWRRVWRKPNADDAGRFVSDPMLGTIKQLSLEEREQIQHVRSFWRLHGREAVRQLHALFFNIRNRLRSTTYWSRLLEPELSRLWVALADLDAAVADDSSATLSEAQSCLNRVWSAYEQAAYWILEIRDKEQVDFSTGSLAADVESWRATNSEFVKELRALSTRPEHNGVLTMPDTASYVDSRLREFLSQSRSAVTSGEAALMTNSATNEVRALPATEIPERVKLSALSESSENQDFLNSVRAELAAEDGSDKKAH